jgi:protein ImuB
LTKTSGGRASIVARCNEAARRGVRVGLSLAEAEALIDPRIRQTLGAPWVEEASEERDLRALHALGMWLMGRFSPVVALDPPDGLFLDVAGTERLFGDEHELCRTILGGMHRFGLGARIAVADTIGAAWAVSRYGQTPRTILDSGEEQAALGSLPIEALRLPNQSLVDALRELGVSEIKQLMDLDRDRVAARFGADVGLRLDQALGRAFEPITPLVYETPPVAERTFEGPVKSLAAIIETAQALVTELTRDLARARRGLLEGRLVLKASDLPARHVPLTLARPSADAKHLWTMLKPKVDLVHMGFGIESVRLVAIRTGRLPTRQSSAFGADGEERPASGCSLDKHVGELIDILVARLGLPAVVVPQEEATHLPERAFTLHPPGEPRSRAQAAAPAAAPHRDHPRPSKLFTPPEPATFDLQDNQGAPQRLRWRGIAYRVQRARGPERIARPWWDDTPAWPDGSAHTVRDYFRLETSCGRSLWTFQEPKHGRAFVHGEWT